MVDDHINTALSSGIGEIIEVAMAKTREDRYPSTEDLLEDLHAVQEGQPPIHARRQIDIEHLTKIEESGRTVDIEPHHHLAAIWSNPIVITLLILCGLSFLANVIFLIVTMK